MIPIYFITDDPAMPKVVIHTAETVEAARAFAEAWHKGYETGRFMQYYGHARREWDNILYIDEDGERVQVVPEPEEEESDG